MNVIGVDDANKIITVMFGGAWSGDYFISIRHSAYGLVNTKGLNFVVFRLSTMWALVDGINVGHNTLGDQVDELTLSDA